MIGYYLRQNVEINSNEYFSYDVFLAATKQLYEWFSPSVRLSVTPFSGLPAVREKSGKIFIFQGQGKVREFCEKSGKIFEWRKVREKSGNFVMNARNIFFMEVDTLLFLI